MALIYAAREKILKIFISCSNDRSLVIYFATMSTSSQLILIQCQWTQTNQVHEKICGHMSAGTVCNQPWKKCDGHSLHLQMAHKTILNTEITFGTNSWTMVLRVNQLRIRVLKFVLRIKFNDHEERKSQFTNTRDERAHCSAVIKTLHGQEPLIRKKMVILQYLTNNPLSNVIVEISKIVLPGADEDFCLWQTTAVSAYTVQVSDSKYRFLCHYDAEVYPKTSALVKLARKWVT